MLLLGLSNVINKYHIASLKTNKNKSSVPDNQNQLKSVKVSIYKHAEECKNNTQKFENGIL